MKFPKIMIAAALVGMTLTGCNDFLDQKPTDSIDDSEFWQNEGHCRTFAMGFYSSLFGGYGSGNSQGVYGYGQSLNDDMVDGDQTDITSSTTVTHATDASYNYDMVRRANYMIEKVAGMDKALTTEAYNHWMGIGRLFRALRYSDLIFGYGDVQWYDHRLDAGDRDGLYQARMPRWDADRMVMEDMRYALQNIRTKDGDLQINRYVAAGLIARKMLREGTFLRYNALWIYPDNAAECEAAAKECLALAKEACLVAMSGPYTLCDDYHSLFCSDDLAGNPEVLIYRKYVDGELQHTTLVYNNNQPQAGVSKSHMLSYLGTDGLPVLYTNADYAPKTAEDFFKDRDGRMSMSVRPKYYLQGEKQDNGVGYAKSGYSMQKFMDPSKEGSKDNFFTATGKAVTDCPVLRLGEVLVTYAEACYELGSLTQADLDKSINVLRARRGVNLPALQIAGDMPAVNGVSYDDPARLAIDPGCPALLWEIRRERRVELAFEGFRLDDLKRWHCLDYIYNGVNPDIRYGAYIVGKDHPDAKTIQWDGADKEGYILVNYGRERQAPQARDYIKPIPKDQLQLFIDNGYGDNLKQNPCWGDY